MWNAVLGWSPTTAPDELDSTHDAPRCATFASYTCGNEREDAGRDAEPRAQYCDSDPCQCRHVLERRAMKCLASVADEYLPLAIAALNDGESGEPIGRDHSRGMAARAVRQAGDIIDHSSITPSLGSAMRRASCVIGCPQVAQAVYSTPLHHTSTPHICSYRSSVAWTGLGCLQAHVIVGDGVGGAARTRRTSSLRRDVSIRRDTRLGADAACASDRSSRMGV